jgi:ABC-type bacteriocin/lantibiotic exporter with double-glycine peptidase domain
MPRIAMGALALVLTAGCASYQGSARDADPRAISREKGWIMLKGVPEIRQTKEHDCGAAAMVSVLTYWQKPVKVADVRAHGNQARLSAGELRAFARKRGFEAFAIHGTFQDLRHELAAGRPVLVGVGKPYSKGKLLAHYQVVVGLNPETKRVLVMDPGSGFQTNTLDGFDSEWKPTGRVTLVMIPADAPGERK